MESKEGSRKRGRLITGQPVPGRFQFVLTKATTLFLHFSAAYQGQPFQFPRIFDIELEILP
jgi:hypothetical protein